MATTLKKITLELTEADANTVAEFIELNIFDYIRKDTETDNIMWLCLMTDVYRKLMGRVEQEEQG